MTSPGQSTSRTSGVQKSVWKCFVWRIVRNASVARRRTTGHCVIVMASPQYQTIAARIHLKTAMSLLVDYTVFNASLHSTEATTLEDHTLCSDVRWRAEVFVLLEAVEKPTHLSGCLGCAHAL